MYDASLLPSGGCHCTKFDQLVTRKRDMFVVIVLGLFLARIRWFSEQKLDAITTEALQVRTGVVGYSRISIVGRDGRFESDTH